MYKIKGFKPREYQKNIVKTCLKNNTLVCLPTGTGKTKIAIDLTIQRLNQFEKNQAIIVSPTKPLSSQIAKELSECSNIENVTLLTGTVAPKKRGELFEKSEVIVATPQTIESDVKNKRISLENTCLLVVDECHRSKEKFANTVVAKEYMRCAKNPRILALTASPGATKEKIGEVCKNLYIKDIELRTEIDEDLSPHIQKKENENLLFS